MSTGEHLLFEQVVICHSDRLQLFRITELARACSSAGRAPALQASSVNHISAASGVAYTKTRGATNPLKRTDVGPKASACGSFATLSGRNLRATLGWSRVSSAL